MNNPIILQTLIQLGKSYQGIIGSFIIDDEGVVAEKAIPELFSDCNFDQIAVYVSDIYLALADPASTKVKIVRPYNDIEMKFNTISLLCRGMSKGYLLILVEVDANLTKVTGLSDIAMIRIERTYKSK